MAAVGGGGAPGAAVTLPQLPAGPVSHSWAGGQEGGMAGFRLPLLTTAALALLTGRASGKK